MVIQGPISSATIQIWCKPGCLSHSAAHVCSYANPVAADMIISVWSSQARWSHSIPCHFQPCQFQRVHAPAAYGGNTLSWELVSWLGLLQLWDRWRLTGPLRETVLSKDIQPTLSYYLGSAHFPCGLFPAASPRMPKLLYAIWIKIY